MLFRRSYRLQTPLLVALDYLMIVCAEQLAYVLRRDLLPNAAPGFHIPDVYLFIIVPFIFLAFLRTTDAHFRTFPLWKVAEGVAHAICYALLAITMLMFFAQVGGVVSRLFVGMTGVFALVFVLGARLMLRRVLNRRRLFEVPVVYVGRRQAVLRLARFIERAGGYGLRCAGFSFLSPGTRPLEGALARAGAEHVVIVGNGLSAEEQVACINRIQPLARSVVFVPDLPGAPVANLELEGILEGRHLFLRMENNLAHRNNRAIKRVFDLVCCTLGLALVVPVCLLIAVAVRLDSKGPAFFVQRRVGQGGQLFPCYKFRTMIPDAEDVLQGYLAKHPAAQREWKTNYKLQHDPRVTRLGAFLRRTSLDELPQVFNVLKGDMSLVGPRPIVTDEIAKYGEYFRDFCLVPPGITGLWQASGRSDTTYDERVRMDTWYVRNWSLWIDIVCLAKTVVVVLRREGAY